jgi:hypothetical protein
MASNRSAAVFGVLLATALLSGCGEGSDDEPSDTSGGSNATGGSGVSVGGGTSTMGGRAGGGASGSGTGGAATGEGWTFDTDMEEGPQWVASYSSPATLAAASDVSHDATEGNPGPGSLRIVIPFAATQAGGPEGNQKIHVGASVGTASADETALDLTGKTVRARFKLVEGLTTDTTNPGGAKLYVKSGEDFVWADGGWTNIETLNWMALTINVSSPLYQAPGFDPTDIREIGIEIATSGGVAATMGLAPATVLIDSVLY